MNSIESFPRIEASFNQARLPSVYKYNVFDLVAFLIPLVRFIEIQIVGKLYVSGLELALLLPVLFALRGKLLRARLPILFLSLATLWLLNQVAADIFRHSTFSNYARGWALIAFTLINFSALYLLLKGRKRRIFLYALGLVIGGVLGYFINPDSFAQAYPWKFGYGGPLTLGVVLLATFVNKGSRRSLVLSALMIFVAALLNLFMDYRALSGICFLAGAYLMAQAYFRRSGSVTRRLKLRNGLLIAVILFGTALTVFAIYKYAAGHGLLGARAERKYEAQEAGEYGLIVGGRSELLVSIRAIAASPILGYGSWPNDCNYARLEIQLRKVLGYGNEGSSESCLLPTHSFVFGAWVSAGVLGAVFWVWVLTLIFRVVARAYRTTETMSPLLAFIAFDLIWAIIFSPYASSELVTVPFYIVVMMEFYVNYTKMKRINV